MNPDRRCQALSIEVMQALVKGESGRAVPCERRRKIMDTGIRTDRIETVREIVSGLLERVPSVSLRASGYVHMFGVAEACVFLAMKRGEDVELAAAAGYLHDIATYTTGNPSAHARRGAEMARGILTDTGLFSEAETEKICAAIHFHSDKKHTHGPLEEILKDADVMQHCLFDPGHVAKKEQERFENLRKEFGL